MKSTIRKLSSVKEHIMALKSGQKGFTLIELVVVVGIASFVTFAAAMTIFQMWKLSAQTGNWAIALRQVENTGYWIARDVEMSKGQITVDPTGTDFLQMTIPQSPTDDRTIVYQWENMPDGLKRLIRNDQTADQQNVVAELIYSYSATYSGNCTDNCTMNLTVTADSAGTTVTRQYRTAQRVPSQ